MKRDFTIRILGGALVVLLLAGPLLPRWAMFLITLSLCYGTVVLGMMLLMRTGVVSFGHGLYYCLGAYAAGTLDALFGVSDIAVMLLAAVVATGVVSALLGLLLRRYRDIFFAMLSLAFSMILYGLLVKTSALGSSDGFNVAAKTLFGIRIAGTDFERYLIFAITVLIAFLAAVCIHKYLASHMGRLAGAIRDNELRVEYMGASVRNTIHINYVMSAVLAGLGGAMAAVSVGHIDPEMSYWTTSGEFVFVAILAGTGSVLAPFLGAFIFETIRSFAYEYSPNTWQMALGTTMLLVIMFLPGGLWSVFEPRSYRVFSHPREKHKYKAIKIGFSWPALFLTVLWMVYSRLWKHAAVWVAVYLLLVIGEAVVISLMTVLGIAAPLITRVTGALVLLILAISYIALGLIPAVKGNEWRERKLLKLGYRFLEVGQARTSNGAIKNVMAIVRPELQKTQA